MQSISTSYFPGPVGFRKTEKEFFQKQVFGRNNFPTQYMPTRQVERGHASQNQRVGQMWFHRAVQHTSLFIRNKMHKAASIVQEMVTPHSFSHEKGWIQKFYKIVAFGTKAANRSFPTYKGTCDWVEYLIIMPRGWAIYKKMDMSWQKSEKHGNEVLASIQEFEEKCSSEMNFFSPEIKQFIEDSKSTKRWDAWAWWIGGGKVVRAPLKAIAQTYRLRECIPSMHNFTRGVQDPLGYFIQLALIRIVAYNCWRNAGLVYESMHKQEIVSKNEIKDIKVQCNQKLEEGDPILYAIWEAAYQKRGFKFQSTYFLIEFSKLFCLTIDLFGYCTFNYWITFFTAIIELGFSYYRYQQSENQAKLREALCQKQLGERGIREGIRNYLALDDGTMATSLLYTRIRGKDPLEISVSEETVQADHTNIVKIFKFDQSTLDQMKMEIIPERMAKEMIRRRLFYV